MIAAAEKENRQTEATTVEELEKIAADIDGLLAQRDNALKFEARAAVASKREERYKQQPIRPTAGGGSDKPELFRLMLRSLAEPNDAEKRNAYLSAYRDAAVAEKRTMLVGSDSLGGFLAPARFINEIIKSETELAPFRQVARIMPMSGNIMQIPKRTGQFSASWSSELGTRSEATGLTFGLEEIRAHELTAVVKLSNQMIEDGAFDVEQFAMDEIAEQFAVAESTAFVTGNGIGRPWGFTVDTAITSTNSGTNGDFDGDDLIDLMGSLKGTYQSNAVWMFNRTTYRKIRKLKANNEYIWQVASNGIRNIAAAAPGEILGRPYFIAPEMQSTGTTGNVSVAVGDFRRGYYIFDSLNMSVLRDPYSAASTNELVLWARRRVGGQVVLGEAINRLAESA